MGAIEQDRGGVWCTYRSWTFLHVLVGELEVSADLDIDIVIVVSDAGKYGLRMARCSTAGAAELQVKIQVLDDTTKYRTKDMRRFIE